jgi:ABC-2 type transport system permease protein
MGLDSTALAALDRRIRLEQRLADPRGKVSGADKVVAAVMAMLLIVAIFGTGSYLAIGITGEKQVRMTEVVVSAIRPQSWIDGKIIAYTLLGAVQAVLWAMTGVAFLFFTRAMAMPAALNAGVIVASLAFFVLGLAFYVALFSIIMATIKDLQSSSKLQAYFFFLPMIPLIFLEGMLRSPDATWIAVLSIMPPFSPIMIPVRLALAAVPWWEVVLALVLLVVATHYLRLAAGHAFRIGMLMYGKELNLPELWRWARQP